MGEVSPQLEKLFIPMPGKDKVALHGIWDIASSNTLRTRIDTRMRRFISISSARSFGGIPKLACVLGTAAYQNLLDKLTEAGQYFSAGLLKLDANAPKPGRPPKPEVQILCYDVREALSSAFGDDVRVWQCADNKQQSFALVVARIVAGSVDEPLSTNLRNILKKARKIERL